PDIRHVIIGNEGALCFITEVTVKIFRYYPENNYYLGYILESMETGFDILREVVSQGYRPSVARLYDPEDGEYHFSHFSEGKCVLIFISEGPKPLAEATAKAISDIVDGYGLCTPVAPKIIQRWFENLNWDPDDLIEEEREIIETKNICNTTEISANWSIINRIYEVCMERIRNEIPDLTLLGGHSSHSYINGTNLYFVYFYNVVGRPEDELIKYHMPIKKIIVEETIKAGGSMCHHHGVGKHRTRWIKDEYGSSYYILKTLKDAFDPKGIMNQGPIFPVEGCLNILTCFGISPDLEMLAEEDWVIENRQVNVSFVNRELNCFDESALEMGLRLAESSRTCSLSCFLTALNVGGKEADPFLKKLYALKFDSAVRIDCAGDLRFAPFRIAGFVAEYVKRNLQDVILMGSQSSMGNNGQTPLLLAEMLGVPCITQVCKVTAHAEDRLQVISRLDDGELTQLVKTPCILVVGNAQNMYLRVPTLKDKMKYGKKPLKIIAQGALMDLADFRDTSERFDLKDLEKPKTQRVCTVIEEGTPAEKAQVVFENYLKKRLKTL
nr:hypothetical protein [Spirochaetales bacterium]